MLSKHTILSRTASEERPHREDVLRRVLVGRVGIHCRPERFERGREVVELDERAPQIRVEVRALARRHAVGRERGVDAVLALVCAYAALLVPLVVLIGQLALFHAMLVRRGLTTYEYILGEQRVDERPSAPPRTICEPCAPPIPPATPEDSPDLVVVERALDP